MTATATLSTLGPEGHLVLTWNPDSPDEVARAEAEFARLREQGYLLFASRQQVGDFDPARVPLDVQPPPEPVAADMVEVLASEPAPRRARRTVATRPCRGG